MLEAGGAEGTCLCGSAGARAVSGSNGFRFVLDAATRLLQGTPKPWKERSTWNGQRQNDRPTLKQDSRVSGSFSVRCKHGVQIVRNGGLKSASIRVSGYCICSDGTSRLGLEGPKWVCLANDGWWVDENQRCGWAVVPVRLNCRIVCVHTTRSIRPPLRGSHQRQPYGIISVSDWSVLYEVWALENITHNWRTLR